MHLEQIEQSRAVHTSLLLEHIVEEQKLGHNFSKFRACASRLDITIEEAFMELYFVMILTFFPPFICLHATVLTLPQMSPTQRKRHRTNRDGGKIFLRKQVTHDVKYLS